MNPSRTSRRHMRALCALVMYLLLSASHPVWASAAHASITDTSMALPSMEQLIRVVSLRDHNTRVVILGAMLLGACAGVIGTFMLLRKRALVGDVASHATLPGIGLAFIIMVQCGGTGKSLPGLLLGATISAAMGMLMILFIRRTTRLKEDAAMGIVMSVFFGLGVSILVVIQKMSTGHAAGLESFIYGKTASMLASDATLIGGAALLVTLLSAFLYKEFKLLCFDQAYAAAQGWPVLVLDVLLMLLVVTVTVIGLQAVGLILIIALLIIPPAAARFWTHTLSTMVVVSAIIGAVSGLMGAAISALLPRMPAGAVIVVVASCFFLLSMLFAPARGVLHRVLEQRTLNRKVAKQHLLRSIYEQLENAKAIAVQDDREAPRFGVPWSSLMADRGWMPGDLRRATRRAEREGLLYRGSKGLIHLTKAGWADARRVVRNHRLWEMYLITHADIAPSHVDRDADQIEHVLGRPLVDRLESLLMEAADGRLVPPSPHKLGKAV